MSAMQYTVAIGLVVWSLLFLSNYVLVQKSRGFTKGRQGENFRLFLFGTQRLIILLLMRGMSHKPIVRIATYILIVLNVGGCGNAVRLLNQQYGFDVALAVIFFSLPFWGGIIVEAIITATTFTRVRRRV
jgi:hypothetical protein